jgi:hypothetical protein
LAPINILEPCKEKKYFLIKALVHFLYFLGLKYVASNASHVQEIIMEVYVHFFHVFKKKNIDVELHMHMKNHHHHMNYFNLNYTIFLI